MAQLQRLAIAADQIQQQQIQLRTEQQHYLLRVLRLRPGDHFIAMNGQGDWWLAAIAPDPAWAQLLEPMSVQTELPVAVTLLAALPKGNGFEEVVRSTTELGVSRIVPVLSDRTLLKPSNQKLERWRRIAREAAEQSQRQMIPEIQEPLPWLESLQLGLEGTRRFFCVTDPVAPPLLHYLKPTSNLAEIFVAVGPEGGWTAAETAAAIAAGYQPVSLGRRILRAVTAPVVALSLLAHRLEF